MASKYLSDDPDLHLYDEIVDEATDLSGSLRIGPVVATAQDIFDKFIINLGLRESVKWSEVRPLTQRLIDQGVHTFHLNRITDLFPNEPVIALEMLQMISSQATTISELTIRGKMCTRYRNMHLEIKTEICKMKSLKKLEIEKFHFYVQDLIEFCPQLPALQLIKVKIAPTIPVFEDRDQAKEFVESLKHLKVFFFNSMWYSDATNFKFQAELTRFCILRMPRLRFVGEPILSVDMTTAIENQREMSSLQHISIVMNDSQPQIATFCKFPFVRDLVIKWDKNKEYPPMQDYNLDAMLQFRHLRALQLNHLASLSHMEYLLTHFGERLEVLCVVLVKNTVRDIRFTMIFSLCPNLELLILKNIPNPVNDAAWIMSSFNRLKKLYLKVNRSANDEPVRLSDFLLGRNLTEVTLDGLTVSAEQLKATNKLILDTDMLSQIIEFRLLVNPRNVTESYEEDLKKEGMILEKTLTSLRPSAIVVVFNILPMVGQPMQTVL